MVYSVFKYSYVYRALSISTDQPIRMKKKLRLMCNYKRFSFGLICYRKFVSIELTKSEVGMFTKECFDDFAVIA